MADSSQSCECRLTPEPTKSLTDVECKLFCVEPVEEGELEQHTACREAKCNLHLSGPSNVKFASPRIDDESTTFNSSSAEIEQGRPLYDADWRLINEKPSDFVCSIEGRFGECTRDVDKPGPSSDTHYDGSSKPGVSTQHPQIDWNMINVETTRTDYSSASRQYENEKYCSPGPSKEKKHTTILKKSTLGRQGFTENRKSCMTEQEDSVIATLDDWTLDCSSDSGKEVQQLKQQTEKDSQKRVHFGPKAESDLFYVCDGKIMKYDAESRSGVEYETRILTETETNSNTDVNSHLWPTYQGMPSAAFYNASHLEENIKGADMKDTLKTNISIVLHENSSSNNHPVDRSPHCSDSHSRNENQDAHQQEPKLCESASVNYDGEDMEESQCINSVDRASKISCGPAHWNNTLISRSPPAVFENGQCQTGTKAAVVSQSHTERMVALFTNLHIQQTSPPLAAEKTRRGKLFNGKADCTGSINERLVNSGAKENTSATNEKIRKQETVLSPNGNNTDAGISTSAVSSTAQDIPTVNKEKERGLESNKESVEAVLLVLHSMQSMLVRMAKMANSTNADSYEEIGSLTKKRKKAPWKISCPKDREVMPDGLFAYSIAHQVVGQAYKKISELYPDCASPMQLESEKGRVLGEKDSVVLALTAMKEVLRDLEDCGVADKAYISTAVETSNSLTSATENSALDHKQYENNTDESKHIAVSIINDLLEVATSKILDRHEHSSCDNVQVLSSSDVTAKESYRLQTELKMMSFELVSRTMREAVSTLTETKSTMLHNSSMSFVKRHELCLENRDASDKAPNNEIIPEVPCSSSLPENTYHRDDQSAACFIDNISGEVHGLISRLLNHLKAVDSREELNAMLAGTDEHSSNTSIPFTNTEYNKQDVSLDVTGKTTVIEENVCSKASTGSEYSLHRQSRIELQSCIEHNRTERKESKAAHLQCAKDETFKCSQSSSEHSNISSFPSREKQTESMHNICPDVAEEGSPGNETENTDTKEEMCHSDESTKCVNSSSQTTGCSIERLFEMPLAEPQLRMDTQIQDFHEASSEETFEYASPSTLFALQTTDDSREDQMRSPPGFGNLQVVRSTDMLVIPPGIFHMAGGNHPEHVQQADQNRPSSSSEPNRQVIRNKETPERAVTSRSVPTAMAGGQRHSCLSTTPGAPGYHQPRATKFLVRRKHSLSEPKLDFYKRTKALDCTRVRRRMFESPDSNISEWTILTFLPPRIFSEIVAPDEESETDDYETFSVEFDDEMSLEDVEAAFGLMATSMSNDSSLESPRVTSNSRDSNSQGCSSQGNESTSSSLGIGCQNLCFDNQKETMRSEKDAPETDNCDVTKINTETQDSFKSSGTNVQLMCRNNTHTSGLRQAKMLHEKNEQIKSDTDSSIQTCQALFSCSSYKSPSQVNSCDCPHSNTSSSYAICSHALQDAAFPSVPTEPSFLHPASSTDANECQFNHHKQIQTSCSKSSNTCHHVHDPVASGQCCYNGKVVEPSLTRQCSHLPTHSTTCSHPSTTRNLCCQPALQNDAVQNRQCGKNQEELPRSWHGLGLLGNRLCGSTHRTGSSAISSHWKGASVNREHGCNNKNKNGTGRTRHSCGPLYSREVNCLCASSTTDAVHLLQQGIADLQGQVKEGLEQLKLAMCDLYSDLHKRQAVGQDRAQEGAEQGHYGYHSSPSSHHCCTPQQVLPHGDTQSGDRQVPSSTCCTQSVASHQVASVTRQASTSVDHEAVTRHLVSSIQAQRVDGGVARQSDSPIHAQCVNAVNGASIQTPCVRNHGLSPSSQCPHMGSVSCCAMRRNVCGGLYKHESKPVPCCMLMNSASIDTRDVHHSDSHRVCDCSVALCKHLSSACFLRRVDPSVNQNMVAHACAGKQSETSSATCQMNAAVGAYSWKGSHACPCEAHSTCCPATEHVGVVNSNIKEGCSETCVDIKENTLELQAAVDNISNVLDNDRILRPSAKTNGTAGVTRECSDSQTTDASESVSVDVSDSIQNGEDKFVLRSCTETEPSHTVNTSQNPEDKAEKITHSYAVADVPRTVVDAAVKMVEALLAVSDDQCFNSHQHGAYVCHSGASDSVAGADSPLKSQDTCTQTMYGLEAEIGTWDAGRVEKKNTFCTGTVHSCFQCSSSDVTNIGANESNLCNRCNSSRYRNGGRNPSRNPTRGHLKVHKKTYDQYDDSTQPVQANCSADVSSPQSITDQNHTTTNNDEKKFKYSQQCTTFLVCAGKNGLSSAIVIQPLSPSGPRELKEAACQVSDEYLCDTTRENAVGAESDSSEISVARSISLSPLLDGEAVDSTDAVHSSSSPCPDTVICKTLTSAHFDALSSFTNSASGDSISSMEGVCEISHSGCQACKNSSDSSICPGEKDASQPRTDQHTTADQVEDIVSTDSSCAHCDHCSSVDTENECSARRTNNWPSCAVDPTKLCIENGGSTSNVDGPQSSEVSIPSTESMDLHLSHALPVHAVGEKDPAGTSETHATVKIGHGVRYGSSHVDPDFSAVAACDDIQRVSCHSGAVCGSSSASVDCSGQDDYIRAAVFLSASVDCKDLDVYAKAAVTTGEHLDYTAHNEYVRAADSLSASVDCTGQEDYVRTADSLSASVDCTGHDDYVRTADSLSANVDCKGLDEYVRAADILSARVDCTGHDDYVMAPDSMSASVDCTGLDNYVRAADSLSASVDCKGHDNYVRAADSLSASVDCTGRENPIVRAADSLSADVDCTGQDEYVRAADSLSANVDCPGNDDYVRTADSLSSSCVDSKGLDEYARAADFLSARVDCKGLDEYVRAADSLSFSVDCTGLNNYVRTTVSTGNHRHKAYICTNNDEKTLSGEKEIVSVSETGGDSLPHPQSYTKKCPSGDVYPNATDDSDHNNSIDLDGPLQRASPTIAERNKGRCSPECFQNMLLSTSETDFKPHSFRPGVDKEQSPCSCTNCTMPATDIATLASGSLATSCLTGSSHVDPISSLYNPSWLRPELCTSATSTCETSATSGGDGLSLCTEETMCCGLDVDADHASNNLRRLWTPVDSVDGHDSGLGMDRRLARSRSEEQLYSKGRVTRSWSKDTLTSLQLLNLSSRATRLALENRVLSLQQILKRMEECEELSMSPVDMPAGGPQLCPALQTNSSQTEVTTLTSQGNSWLDDCGSDELLQMVDDQLSGLDTPAERHRAKHANPLPTASDARQNTNSNYDGTANASTSTSTLPTHWDRADTVTSRRETFSGGFRQLPKTHSGLTATVREATPSVAHYSHSFCITDHKGVSVDEVDFCDSPHISEKCNRTVNARLSNFRADFSEATSVTEKVHRGVSTDPKDVRVDVMNFADTFGKGVYRGVCVNASDIVDAVDNANSCCFSETETPIIGITAGNNESHVDVLNLADSFSATQISDGEESADVKDGEPYVVNFSRPCHLKKENVINGNADQLGESNGRASVAGFSGFNDDTVPCRRGLDSDHDRLGTSTPGWSVAQNVVHSDDRHTPYPGLVTVADSDSCHHCPVKIAGHAGLQSSCSSDTLVSTSHTDKSEGERPDECQSVSSDDDVMEYADISSAHDRYGDADVQVYDVTGQSSVTDGRRNEWALVTPGEDVSKTKSENPAPESPTARRGNQRDVAGCDAGTVPAESEGQSTARLHSDSTAGQFTVIHRDVGDLQPKETSGGVDWLCGHTTPCASFPVCSGLNPSDTDSHAHVDQRSTAVTGRCTGCECIHKGCDVADKSIATDTLGEEDTQLSIVKSSTDRATNTHENEMIERVDGEDCAKVSLVGASADTDTAPKEIDERVGEDDGGWAKANMITPSSVSVTVVTPDSVQAMEEDCVKVSIVKSFPHTSVTMDTAAGHGNEEDCDGVNDVHEPRDEWAASRHCHAASDGDSEDHISHNSVGCRSCGNCPRDAVDEVMKQRMKDTERTQVEEKDMHKESGRMVCTHQVCDTGVQCTIPDDVAVRRAKAESRHWDGMSPQLLGSVSADGQDCRLPPRQSHDTQHTVPLQAQLAVLQHYRQRVSSLEREVRLEKQLHDITKASLCSLTRDHDTFRTNVLLGKQHKATRGLF